MNAVACEVEVIATGARPAEKGGKRELFTEETTTALVFENGGVLRLAAAVVPGQLLFLTHKESKREVVAQVRSKRNFRSTICYVEVEFSEPSPGFWGIKFPEKPALVPANAQQKEADESAQAEEAILADEPSAPRPAPSAREIAMLKEEVDALREQLKLLRIQSVTAKLPAPAMTPALFRPTAPEPPRAPMNVPTQALLRADASSESLQKLQSATGEMSQGLPTEASGALESANAAPPLASMSLPIDRAEPPFSEEDFLPKPALNFKDAGPLAKPASKPMEKVAADIQRAAVRKDLFFAAFLLVVAGAAWYQNLLPWLPQPKNLFSSTASGVAAHPAPHAAQRTANAQADSGKSPQTSGAPTAPPSAVLHDASKSAALGTAKRSTLPAPETPGAVKSASDGDADGAAVREKPDTAAVAGKRSAPLLLSSKAGLDSAASPSDGVAIVPPKLIKSVRAIASPNALQDFSSGNGDSVTFDALVDTSGQVKSMKVLSGSASLQSTAMEALKQYRYEPATRHGKPVPAHVTVTIKFLFEP
jgi:TonB family protein